MSEGKSASRVGATKHYLRWQPPAWDAPGTENKGVPSTPVEAAAPLSASALEQLQRDAYEEAYALGLQEGLAAGREQRAAEAERWHALIDELDQPSRAVDERVEAALVRLVKILVGQIVGRELRDSPAVLLGWVQSGLAVLPDGTGHVEIRLHPVDAAWIREQLANQPHCHVVEDGQLAQGACRIQKGDAQVDAGLDARLMAAFAHVFDESRLGAEIPDGD
mgnify:CR=1 FL=1